MRCEADRLAARLPGPSRDPSLVTQEELAKGHTDKHETLISAIRRIEKASDALWQLLLGMLDKATLTLATIAAWTSRRSFSSPRTWVAGEITELMEGGMGFVQLK